MAFDEGRGRSARANGSQLDVGGRRCGGRLAARRGGRGELAQGDNQNACGLFGGLFRSNGMDVDFLSNCLECFSR